MSETTVIQGPWEARVVAHPRRHFGLRKPGQAVSDFLNATLDKLPVCPTMETELAAEIGVVAKLCDVLVNSAQACRNTHAAAALRTIQGELETLSAEVFA